MTKTQEDRGRQTDRLVSESTRAASRSQRDGASRATEEDKHTDIRAVNGHNSSASQALGRASLVKKTCISLSLFH